MPSDEPVTWNGSTSTRRGAGRSPSGAVEFQGPTAPRHLPTAKGLKYLSYDREQARQYDESVVGLVPGYPRMIAEIVRRVSAEPRTLPVIDFGAGTGTLVERLLSASPGHQALLLDFSEAMCRRAAAKLRPFSGRSLVVRKALESAGPRPGMASAVVSTLTLHECRLDRRSEVLRRMVEALAPGGLLIVGDYYQASPLDRQAHALEVRRHAARHLISAGEIEAEIDEHLFDPGMPILQNDWNFLSGLHVEPIDVLPLGAGVSLWWGRRTSR